MGLRGFCRHGIEYQPDYTNVKIISIRFVDGSAACDRASASCHACPCVTVAGKHRVSHRSYQFLVLKSYSIRESRIFVCYLVGFNRLLTLSIWLH